jgi:hypothetical protein
VARKTPSFVRYSTVQKRCGPIRDAPPSDWCLMRRKYDPLRIITIVDAGNRGVAAVAGWAYVNRLHYLLTTTPMPEEWVEARLELRGY